jgi:hypothetical protein
VGETATVGGGEPILTQLRRGVVGLFVNQKRKSVMIALSTRARSRLGTVAACFESPR